MRSGPCGWSRAAADAKVRLAVPMIGRRSPATLTLLLVAVAPLNAKPDFTQSTVTADPANVQEGDLVTFSVLLVNSGDQDAPHTEIDLELPLDAAAVDRGSGAVLRHAQAFDDYLASDAPLCAPVEKLFQGPVADALNHVGQLAMLRRLAGGPVRGENYFKASIETGRVGADQAAPRSEFD
jgi:hypothetical protein